MRRFGQPLVVGAALLVVQLLVACGDDVVSPAREAPRLLLSEAAVAASLADLHDHVVVLGSERAPSDELLAAIAAAGGSVISRYDRIGVLVVSGLTEGGAQTLAERAEVEAASRDVSIRWHREVDGLRAETARLSRAASPADAFFFDAFQWNMRQIQADLAWDATPRGAGALVCVLDTGIDPTHIDLDGRVDLAASASFIAEPDIPGIPGLDGQFDIFDYRFHGTFVASQVATNSLGMASVAPEATLCGVKVLNVFGTGPFTAITAGIVHAADVGADVLNLSLGALVDLSQAEGELKALLLAMQRAILYANARGSLVIAAAGNEGLDLRAERPVVHVPSQMVGVVSVSATGPTDQADFDGFAPYSNFGGITAVTVAAPGGSDPFSTGNPLDGIFGACSSFQLTLPFACDRTTFVSGASGTSYAAPHVAGLAAVVESAVRGNAFGALLATCVIRGAERIDGRSVSPQYGFGRINVHDSVRQFGCGRSLRPFAQVLPG